MNDRMFECLYIDFLRCTGEQRKGLIIDDGILSDSKLGLLDAQRKDIWTKDMSSAELSAKLLDLCKEREKGPNTYGILTRHCWNIIHKIITQRRLLITWHGLGRLLFSC